MYGHGSIETRVASTDPIHPCKPALTISCTCGNTFTTLVGWVSYFKNSIVLLKRMKRIYDESLGILKLLLLCHQMTILCLS
jgi:hypothetical protein